MKNTNNNFKFYVVTSFEAPIDVEPTKSFRYRKSAEKYGEKLVDKYGHCCIDTYVGFDRIDRERY